MQTYLLKRHLATDYVLHPRYRAGRPRSDEKDRRTSDTNDEPPASRSASTTSTAIDQEVLDPERGFPGPEEEKIDVKDPFLVDWEVGDPIKPQNWSHTKKWIMTAALAQLCTMVGIAGSINSQAIPFSASYYNVSTELMSLDTALFLCGFGFASVFWAPLSEVAGRNLVYIIAFTLFIAFECGIAASDAFYQRCLLRFFAGCWATPPLSNAGGGMGDIWTPMERSYAFCCFAVSGFAGPCLGPVLGGYIGESYLGFRWCDWLQAIMASFELILVTFIIPETFPPYILNLKASAIRHRTGDERYMTAMERSRIGVPFIKSFGRSLARPFEMMVLEPIVQFMCLYLTVVYIILFGDLIAWTYIFTDTYDLSIGVSGLTFCTIIVGLVACGLCSPWMLSDYKKMMRRAEARGLKDVPPEARLRIAMLGTWLIPISLFWTAWTTYKSTSIWSPLVAQAMFGMGILTTFVSSYQYLIDTYANVAASALSGVTFLRYIVSGGSVMFTAPMYNRLGVHWALTMLGFISLVMGAIPWIFYYKGARIRSWSKYVPKT